MNYYNEFDPYPAQWLRNLIALGFLPPGDVDTRSIKDVKANDIKGYTQCHFFAGIGGWSHALFLARWPIDRPVWTGSCPCQPFSVAGNQKAQADERHLWPEWYRLIKECRPTTIFGEQVSGAIAHGWLDDVYQGLEAEGYAVGSAILPATSVGAPHRRDRLWFVAMADAIAIRCNENGSWEFKSPSKAITLADSTFERIDGGGNARASRWFESSNRSSISEDVAHTASRREQRGGTRRDEWGLEEEILRSCWHPYDWNVEPDVGRVANGVPARVGRLRAYGNAIVPQVAQAFIEAFMECQP